MGSTFVVYPQGSGSQAGFCNTIPRVQGPSSSRMSGEGYVHIDIRANTWDSGSTIHSLWTF